MTGEKKSAVQPARGDVPAQMNVEMRKNVANVDKRFAERKIRRGKGGKGRRVAQQSTTPFVSVSSVK